MADLLFLVLTVACFAALLAAIRGLDEL